MAQDQPATGHNDYDREWQGGAGGDGPQRTSLESEQATFAPPDQNFVFVCI